MLWRNHPGSLLQSKDVRTYLTDFLACCRSALYGLAEDDCLHIGSEARLRAVEMVVSCSVAIYQGRLPAQPYPVLFLKHLSRTVLSSLCETVVVMIPIFVLPAAPQEPRCPRCPCHAAASAAVVPDAAAVVAGAWSRRHSHKTCHHGD